MDAQGEVACAPMESGLMRCWGEPRRAVVDEAPSSGTFLALDIGRAPSSEHAAEHACAIETDGDLRCWGDDHGIISDTPATGSYTQLSVGRTHACAISTGGSLRCWGSSSDYVWDEPSGSDYRSIHLDPGNYSACAHDDFGYITCWGMGAGTLCRDEDDPGEPYFGCDFHDASWGTR